MNLIFAILLLLITNALSACPTCIGRITQNSPPFFSDEFYKSDTDNMDELYQTVLKTSPEEPPTPLTPQNQKDSL